MTTQSARKSGPVRAQNLVAQVAHELRRQLQSGMFKAGERLNIRSLAAEYDVSPTPLREALAQLAAEGVVSFRENSGYRVREAPTPDEVALWAEARIVIETQAIRLTHKDTLPPKITELCAINARIASGTDSPSRDEIDRFSEANWAFHRILVSLAENQFLDRAHETLNQGNRFSQVFLGRGVRDRAGVVSEHAAIISLLREGCFDAAAEALATHISDSTRRDLQLGMSDPIKA